MKVLGAKQSTVHWQHTAKKIADKTYEIHLTAIIDNGWHTFSATQPKDAIALPTTISFNKNPLVQLKGKVKEVGKIEKYKEKTLGIEQYQFSEKVDFVQVVALKSTPGASATPASGGHLRTNMSGSVSYQTCNDHECLPPKTERFSIVLDQ